MKIRFLMVMVLSLFLSSCAEMAKDIGLAKVSDIDQRSGITGTRENPAILDPFKTYSLVMAANECRFFSMKVPEHWYWKVFLTVVNREDNRPGKLVAEIAPVNPAWQALSNSSFGKKFELNREGVQGVLGVGNPYPSRPALLRFCQDGAPLHITIESQVSTNTDLMGPEGASPKLPSE